MSFPHLLGSTDSLRLFGIAIFVPVIACLLSHLVCRLHPHASAAARHWTWMLAFAGMAICLPVTLLNVRVAWPILPAAPAPPSSPVRPTTLPTEPTVTREQHRDRETRAPDPIPVERAKSLAPAQHPTAPASPGFSWPRLLLGLWTLGFAGLSLSFIAGSLRLRGIVSRSRNAADPRLTALWKNLSATSERNPPIPLLISPEVQIPLVAGLWRPAVILPAAAAPWPMPMLRTALIHELAHLERKDLWCSAIARCVAALYWFNPATWHGLRCLHAEAEMAADDRVVLAESHPVTYAEHLVALVRNLRGNEAALFPAMGMLRSGGIEARVARILDPTPRRLAPSRSVRLIALSGAALITAGASIVRPVVAAAPPARTGPATIAEAAAPGLQSPPSIGLIPGPIVRSIDIYGMDAAAWNTDELIAEMRTRVGEPYSPQRVDEDIRHLASRHRIAIERAFAVQEAGGVAITVVVRSEAKNTGARSPEGPRLPAGRMRDFIVVESDDQSPPLVAAPFLLERPLDPPPVEPLLSGQAANPLTLERPLPMRKVTLFYLNPIASDPARRFYFNVDSPGPGYREQNAKPIPPGAPVRISAPQKFG